jgi:hypothetical protein
MERTPMTPALNTINERSFQEAYSARFIEFQLHWSVFMAAHLFKVRSHFGNLEDPQILCALGLGPLAKVAASARAAGNSESLRWGAAYKEQVGTSAMSLADMTGIPRQTVRRRLQAMEGLGWVCQSDDHLWQLAVQEDGSPRLSIDLFDIHSTLVEDLGQLLIRFADLLRQHRSSVPDDTEETRQQFSESNPS